MLGFWLFEKLQEPLVLFGLTGQFVFMMRFVLQWFATERRGRSYVPVGFWYLSLGGGIMLFVYGLLDHDLVVMFGQSLGLGIYARNLYLIEARRWRYRQRRIVAAQSQAQSAAKSDKTAAAADDTLAPAEG